MLVFINPGSGPVDDATEENAIVNIKHFILDIKGGDDAEYVRIPKWDENGRYGFLIWKNGHCFEILMPGLPLDRVRYMGSNQNIWNFPRLYVDGSSWVWLYAIDIKFSCKEND